MDTWLSDVRYRAWLKCFSLGVSSGFCQSLHVAARKVSIYSFVSVGYHVEDYERGRSSVGRRGLHGFTG